MSSSHSGIFTMPQSPSGVFLAPEPRSVSSKIWDAISKAVVKPIVDCFSLPASKRKRAKTLGWTILDEFRYSELGDKRAENGDKKHSK